MTGNTWLILEYLENSVTATKMPKAAAVVLAAGWIGRFHAANQARLARAPRPCLNTYDANYYRGWARRMSLSAGHWDQDFRWVAALCARWEGFAAPLLAAPPTIIHGEYYPKNVLCRSGIVYPIDWESAAIAAGEIDLASLTEGWPVQIVRQLELEYQQARWSTGTPAGFEQTLHAARLYLHFRWLGDPSTSHERTPWRFEQLRCAGEQLGLI
jgi:aminoglycoside phosphotransferase (APT) family kinase protein